MNENEKLLLFGGLGLLAFLVYRSQGMSAANVALTSNALTAGTAVSNANAIANAANGLGTDASQIVGGIEQFF